MSIAVTYGLGWVLCATFAPSDSSVEDDVLVSGVARVITFDEPGRTHRWTWTSASAGSFALSAESAELHPRLVVRADGVETVEDRGSGGASFASVVVPTAAGVVWTVELGLASEGARGSIELRCIAMPETDATLAAAANARAALARATELVAASQHAEALNLAAATTRSLLDVEGALTSIAVGDALVALGTANAKAGDHASACAARRFHVRQLEAMLPADHPRLAAARVNAANALHRTGAFVEARSLFEVVIATRRRTLDADDPQISSVRSNLAVTAIELGDYQAARSTLQQVVDSLQRTVEVDDRRLISARQNLGSVLKKLGDATGARREYAAVLASRERTAPAGEIAVTWARMNLALVDADFGDRVGASKQLEVVVRESRLYLGDDHPDVARARLNLASVLEALGDVVTARSLTERALTAYENSLPDDHLDLAWARVTLAVMLRKQGDLVGAQALIERALAVFTIQLPERHPDLLDARAQLAVTLFQLGETQPALRLLDEVHDALVATLPADHRALQTARLNLAAACRTHGDFERARELVASVVETRARTLPIGHIDRAIAQLCLASTMPVNAERVERVGAFLEALDGLERALPRDHADVRFARSAALWAAVRAGDVAALDSLVRDVASADQRVLAHGLVGRGEREATVAASQLLASAQQSTALAAGVGTLAPLPAQNAIALASFDAHRSIPLRARALVEAVDTSDESIDAANSIRLASAEVTRLAMRPDARDAYFDAVRALDALHARRVERLAVDDRLASWIELTPASRLGEALPAQSKGVLFARWTRVTFEPPDGMRSSSSDELSAFVLEPSGEVARIDLGSFDTVLAAVEAWRAAVALDDEELEREAGVALRSKVFEPLLPALGETKHVVVVLDDPVHAIAIDALPWREGVVGDEFRIETRTCLAERALRSATTHAGTLVAVGAVDFDHRSVADATSATGTTFPPLPATGIEVESIAAIYAGARAASGEATVLLGGGATRDALFEQAPTARFLHIATHGYLVPVPESFAGRRAEARDDVLSWSALMSTSGAEISVMSPAVLCGLALAGANLPLDAIGRAPGRVTAQELATLDLAHCELAVLSACDTSLGVVRAGQGTASLQAALHAAGARSVVTSLWPVPDEATARLMTEFYRCLWERGDSKADALWRAKQVLRHERTVDGSRVYSTRAWAGFVLTGDP